MHFLPDSRWNDMREGWLILSCRDFTGFYKLKPNTLHENSWRCDKPIYIPLI